MSIRPTLLKIIGQLSVKSKEFKSYPIQAFIERKLDEAKSDIASHRLSDADQEKLERRFQELLATTERQVPLQNMYFVEQNVVQYKQQQPDQQHN